MANELVAYIRQQLGLKVPQDVIVRTLLGQGWKQSDVDQAFGLIAQSEPAAIAGQPMENQEVFQGKNTVGQTPEIVAVEEFNSAPAEEGPGGLQGLLANKTLLMIIGAVVVVIILAVAIIGQLTVKKTENGDQTGVTEVKLAAEYVNAQKKYSIQAPEGWVLKESDAASGSSTRPFAIFLGPTVAKDGNGVVAFNENINITYESVELPLDQYAQKSKDALIKYLQGYQVGEEKNVTAGGTPAKIIGGTFTQNGVELKTLQLFTVKDKVAYVVTGTNLASSWDTDKNLIEASILTFKAP